MATLVDSEGKAEDTMEEHHLNDELDVGGFKEKLRSLSSKRSYSLLPRAQKQSQEGVFRTIDGQEGTGKGSSLPQPQFQTHKSEEETVKSNVEKEWLRPVGPKSQAAVFQSPEYERQEVPSRTLTFGQLHFEEQSRVFRSPQYERQEALSRSLSAGQPHLNLGASEEEDVENNHHEELQTDEVVLTDEVATAQRFQHSVYEEEDTHRRAPTRIPVLREQQMERPLRFSGLDLPHFGMAEDGLGFAPPPTQASRIDAPPQPRPRLRRLSLPDAVTTTTRHHVHEHHHHVWNHQVSGAGASPWLPYAPHVARPPWQPWSQQLRSHRCPTCGRGPWLPGWLLVQFPWGQVCKMAVFGGVLVLVAVGLSRSARILRVALPPPAVD